MKKLIPLIIFFFVINSINSYATPDNVECINNAAIVAKVESFNTSGFLNCEFQCFLDMKYTKFETEPIVYFQIGTLEYPESFLNVALSNEYLKTIECEHLFNDENYKLKLNFGKINVTSNFKARLVIFENGVEKIINLKPTSFQDEITKMNNAEEKDMCKADLFLNKIDFENLYKNWVAL